MATGPSVEEEENAVAYLNSYATKHQLPPPVYEEKSVAGEPHKRTFTITCKFQKFEVTSEGKSKKEAKKSCAVSMVRKMKELGVAGDQSTEYNPVTVLQQLLQKKSLVLPIYDCISEGGVPHNKTFTIRATASNHDGNQFSAEATASSKKEAKKKAANDLYSKLKPVLDKSPKVKTRTTSISQVETTMASLNISGDSYESRSHDPHSGSHDDTDGSMPSINPMDISVNSLDNSVDPLDISVNHQDIDVVYLEGDGSELCLATLKHQGQHVTGCGNGNCKDTAKDVAIDNLMSNLSILYPSLHTL
ncbi:RISC-loading complex subunit tarbp2-like [Dysidea avara]|uniref:RISC-loading complex subunit tarbp2-like n=1 Tax=Dysidea avara TaxID=196820 RepID=UPI00332260BA